MKDIIVAVIFVILLIEICVVYVAANDRKPADPTLQAACEGNNHTYRKDEDKCVEGREIILDK